MRFKTLIIFLFFSMTMSTIWSQVPQTLNYQGVLTDAAGQPVTDGTREMLFRLYDSESGGNELWIENQSVSITDGVFNVILGAETELNIEFGQPLFLGVSIDGGAELSPRIPLSGSAYSFKAMAVMNNAVKTESIINGAITKDKLSENAITNDKLENAAVTSDKIADKAVVKSINGLKDNIIFEAGDNITISNKNNKLIISSIGGNNDNGNITAVNAGEGLTGGGASGEVTLAIADGAITKSKISDGQIVTSLNGLNDSITLEAGNNIDINQSGNKLTISASGGNIGDITAVKAGLGLNGGGSSGEVALDIEVPLFLQGNTSKSNEAIISAKNNGSGYAMEAESKNGSNYVRMGSAEMGLVATYNEDPREATEAIIAGQNFAVQGTHLEKDNQGLLASLDFGVYGQHGETSNYGSLGSKKAGASGFHTSGNYGYLGGEFVGTIGTHKPSNNFGLLGDEDFGVYGKHYATQNYGWLGAENYSVYGYNFIGHTKGYLGGENNGVYGENVEKENFGYLGGESVGVLGENENGNQGILGSIPAGVFGFAAPGRFAGYFNGTVHVSGNLSKSSGSFKIDHPLDPANKYLYHSFVESPDMKNIYDGVAQLDASGEVWVDMPDWFEALNKDFRYQLTCIRGFAQVYIAEKISNNRFKIAGGKPGMEVSWMVTGIRQDAYAEAHRIPVEEIKTADEAGKYLNPVEHGAPKSMAIGFDEFQKFKTKSE